jgi:ppGpp synthetase/RelA/SpoT-type nucleotidyltranferase
MTLDEYLPRQEAYAELAATVVQIIDAGLRLHPELARPLTTQARAKSEVSLRDKLAERGLLEANNIEAEIKDLAGCRLIFYTETDADRFLQSRIVFENFVVEWDNTKIHHPVGDEPKVDELYRARHYIVSMKPERLALPEYARFKGMRVELQIHTMLNNAWSETAHDIIYKDKMPPGFGGKELEGLKRRMARIMTQYLVPAGYEFQKVQHDAERLRQGKEIFDHGPIEQLEKATDNNERWDILERLREQVLPLYDDVPAIHGELMRVIPEVILAARGTPTNAIETSFASFDGHDAKDVAKAGIDILEYWRYIDLAGTFVALCRLWDGAGVEEQKLILGAVERLAEHNLEVWKQAGCGAQAELMRVVGGFSEPELEALRPIIVTVCQHVLEPTVRGSSATYEGVTFRSGPVLIDDNLKRLRSQALEGLERLFKTAGTEDERRATFAAMMTATSHPSAGKYGDEAISLANADSGRIVGFLTAQHAGLCFGLKQHIEHELLYLYRRSPAWFTGCREEVKAGGEALKREIRAFRDAINTDAAYVRQKTLVGFEDVFPEDWDSDGMDVEAAAARRTQRIEALVADVTPATADEWLEVIKQCAATPSNDGATFGSLIEFLDLLARARPQIVLSYLQNVPAELEDFISNVLNGLEEKSSAESQTLMRSWIEAGTYLPQIGRHLRLAKSVDVELVRLFAAKALETPNRAAAIEAAVVVVARPELAAAGAADDVFIPAVEFLTGQKDVGWVHGARFRKPRAPSLRG